MLWSMILIAISGLMVAANPSKGIHFECDSARIQGEPSGACESKLGKFTDARPGPLVSDKPTIAVRYQPERGTNLYHEAVALLQRSGRIYRVLWSHDVVIATAGLADVPDESTVYHWTFNPSSNRISVSGLRTVGKIAKITTAEARGKQRILAAESYCLARASGRFQRCRKPTA